MAPTNEGTQPGRRRIGRILSLGFPLPGPIVDNYGFLSAPSYFDYDAVVIDPRAVGETIERVLTGEEVRTFAGAVVRPSGDGNATLAGEIERRRAEMTTLLEHGGVAVIFARMPASHVADGLPRFDDFSVIPDAPTFVRAEGTTVEILDGHHPLAGFVHHQSANILYEAALDPSSQSGTRVIATSHGGAVIAAELARDTGRVVLLPALKAIPSGQGRYALSEALQSGIRRLVGVMAEGRAPAWVARHPLPGLNERVAALDAARRDADAASRALAAAESAHDDLARFQRLLWQEGALGLEDVVLEALRRIGFEVYARDEASLELRADGSSALLEIEASAEAIGIAPHHRLRTRLEKRIEQRAAAPRGLIVVNAHRLLPPTERPAPATDALLAASEVMGYRIATTASLFEALVASLNGDDAAVAEYRRALLTGSGLLADIPTAVDA